MHKSLPEAWVAIKMPTHLVLVSLLHGAVGSGVPLQDFRKKKRKHRNLFMRWNNCSHLFQWRMNCAYCLFLLSVAHWQLTAPNPTAKPYSKVLHGHRFGVNPLPSHQWGTPVWQKTCWNWQWKMFQHWTAKATDSLKLAVTASIF